MASVLYIQKSIRAHCNKWRNNENLIQNIFIASVVKPKNNQKRADSKRDSFQNECSKLQAQLYFLNGAIFLTQHYIIKFNNFF